MADDKDDRGARDRATVSGDEPTSSYELDYFATKNNLSREKAQALIDRVGNSREALDAAVADRSKATRTTERSPVKQSDKPARTATTRPAHVSSMNTAHLTRHSRPRA